MKNIIYYKLTIEQGPDFRLVYVSEVFSYAVFH